MTTEEILVSLLKGGLVTLEVSAAAWVLATGFGFVLSVIQDLLPAADKPIAAFGTLLRSLPQLVAVYILFFGLASYGINLSPLVAAVVALGITDGAFMSEYFRAGFLTVPATQRDAGRSIGLSSIGVLRRVVVPQAIPYVIPSLLNEFVGLLKTATIASVVGVPEIIYNGTLAYTLTGELALVVAMIVGIYVVVTLPLTRLVGVLETRIRVQTY